MASQGAGDMETYVMNRMMMLCAISLTAMAAHAAETSAPAPGPILSIPGAATVMAIKQGPLEGSSADGVENFLGIPYAVPPVADMRWKNPRAAGGWTTPRKADTFGPNCPMSTPNQGPLSEDCLFINVQRPAGLKADAKLPVLVFIHGGTLAHGLSNTYDMREMIKQNGVIGVTLNYRLGVMGFLGHPAMTKESGGDSGNFGFLDQQLALQWVQDNIASFGGDPTQVTIAGESAGGWSLCAHMVSPVSGKLYSKAVVESGSCVNIPLKQSEDQGIAVAKSLDCDKATGEEALGCLRGKSTDDLLKAGRDIVSRFANGGTVFPMDLNVAMEKGAVNKTPLLIGDNRSEANMFSFPTAGKDEAFYTNWVKQAWPDLAGEIFKRYPWPSDSNSGTTPTLIGQIITDSGNLFEVGGCTQIKWSKALIKQMPVFSYELIHDKGPGFVTAPNLDEGSGHGADLLYLFPEISPEKVKKMTPDEKLLAVQMKTQWGQFTKTGTPNGEKLPVWPTLNESGKLLILTAPPAGRLETLESRHKAHNCDFWDNVPLNTKVQQELINLTNVL